jgi:deoxyuridine 5'-triphosphate nucleotidohydrolase
MNNKTITKSLKTLAITDYPTDNFIKYVLKDNRAVVPTKAHPTDIGYDLTAIDVYKKISKRVTLFETGIAMSSPSGYYIEIIPRSSISKTGYMIANSIGIIDPDYNGTLKIALIKLDDDMPDIKLPFTRCQIVLRKAEYADMKQVTSLTDTVRSNGGFGSTTDRYNCFSNDMGTLSEWSENEWVWKTMNELNGVKPCVVNYLQLLSKKIKNQSHEIIFKDGSVIFNKLDACFNYKNKVFRLKRSN